MQRGTAITVKICHTWLFNMTSFLGNFNHQENLNTSSSCSSIRKVKIQFNIIIYLIVLYFWVQGSIIQNYLEILKLLFRFLASKFQNISTGNFKTSWSSCYLLLLISKGFELCLKLLKNWLILSYPCNLFKWLSRDISMFFLTPERKYKNSFNSDFINAYQWKDTQKNKWGFYSGPGTWPSPTP